MCEFFKMLERRWVAGKRVCIGLDTKYERLPEHFRSKPTPGLAQLMFNMEIVKSTHDLALCYKPNLAFYCGTEDGKYLMEMQQTLLETVAHIRRIDPTIPVILDAKDMDIGNTNNGYVTRAFHSIGADAITIHNYFGMEAAKPFLDQKDKGIIVLCKTSNPGAGEFQNLKVQTGKTVGYQGRDEVVDLYQYVARRVVDHWNYNGNCGLVVGATYPEEISEVRRIVGDMSLLLPGFGTQGASVEDAIRNGLNSKGHGVIPNSSSGIIFAKNPRAATLSFSNEIDGVLSAMALERT